MVMSSAMVVLLMMMLMMSMLFRVQYLGYGIKVRL